MTDLKLQHAVDMARVDTLNELLSRLQKESDTLQKSYQECKEGEQIKLLIWERRTGIITAMDILREMRGEI